TPRTRAKGTYRCTKLTGRSNFHRAPSNGWMAKAPASVGVGSLLRQTRPPPAFKAMLTKSGSPNWRLSSIVACQNEAFSVECSSTPTVRNGAMTSLTRYFGAASDAVVRQNARPRAMRSLGEVVVLRPMRRAPPVERFLDLHHREGD